MKKTRSEWNDSIATMMQAKSNKCEQLWNGFIRYTLDGHRHIVDLNQSSVRKGERKSLIILKDSLITSTKDIPHWEDKERKKFEAVYALPQKKTFSSLRIKFSINVFLLHISHHTFYVFENTKSYHVWQTISSQNVLQTFGNRMDNN